MPVAKPRTPRTQQSKLNFGKANGNPDAKSSGSAKKNNAGNGNILSFFKKVEIEEQLFCGDPNPVFATRATGLPLTPNSSKSDSNGCDDIYGIETSNGDDSRYEEDAQSASKRRKLSHDPTEESDILRVINNNGSRIKTESDSISTSDQLAIRNQIKRPRGKGPFLDDSDSEDDNNTDESPTRQAFTTDISKLAEPTPAEEEPNLPSASKSLTDRLRLDLPVDESCPDTTLEDAGGLKREETADDEQFKGLDDEDMEGLFDDEEDFDDGEEFRARRFMEEQAILEEAEDAGDFTSHRVVDEPPEHDDMTAACPICNSSLTDATSEQATVHVNACLDGKTPVPIPAPPLKPPLADTVEAPEVSKRFVRAAVPRPGQANPITLSAGDDSGRAKANTSTSAFSKLMSGHAEQAAWSDAAAAEHASRGKPAYQRTCPFYKIMPGFFICVDAFRYGAVKGCNAYFLSHFHSDHYIGLSASWCHGPIYCSKVTGSLVKNQLKTAAKWVKELEFEERVEVPGTEGVTVTMLPANHCPGSSLFLFEKVVGGCGGGNKAPASGLENPPSSTPKMQRILHCGDFRACPAQVKHPLLKSEISDALSGKVRQQKIDICYLDTTYLNPRYSFPPQNHVIHACAAFCKMISTDPNAADEVFESGRQGKGNASVSQYFKKEDSNSDALPDKDAKPDDAGNVKNSKFFFGNNSKKKDRLLVICGTYSIGKERICKAIAQALNTKIFASPSKIKICSQLGDPELTALMTSDPREAQVHMQMLMEIRAETLQDYLDSYKPHFSRIVGFRPSGWNFRSAAAISGSAASLPANMSPGTVPTTSILHGPAWRTSFGLRDLAGQVQRGSTREAMCFGVPYSEHSSFRELALFLTTLHIEKVVPTVNVGSEVGRKRMRGWIDKWLGDRRKGGVVRLLSEEEEGDGGEQVKKEEDKECRVKLWDGKDGMGGGAYW